MKAEKTEKAVSDGTCEAVSYWLNNRDVSSFACLEDGVAKAVEKWLDNNCVSIMEMLREVAEERMGQINLEDDE